MFWNSRPIFFINFLMSKGDFEVGEKVVRVVMGRQRELLSELKKYIGGRSCPGSGPSPSQKCTHI